MSNLPLQPTSGQLPACHWYVLYQCLFSSQHLFAKDFLTIRLSKEISSYPVIGTLVVMRATFRAVGSRTGLGATVKRAPFARAAVRGCLDTKHGRAQTTGLAVAPSHNRATLQSVLQPRRQAAEPVACPPHIRADEVAEQGHQQAHRG